MPMLLTEELKTSNKMGQSQPEAVSPLWQSLRTWWLLLPLMYFATDGQIVSSGRHQNSASGLSTTQLIIGLGFWSIALFLMAPASKAIIRASLKYRALTIFMVYSLASSLWSADVIDSMRKASFLSILILFGYFLAEKYRPEEQMRLIFAVGCIIAVGCYFAVGLMPNRGVMSRGQWNGLFGHKNGLGIYLCLYLFAFFFMSRKMTLFRLLGFGVVLLGLIAAYKSQSRTGWVTCAFLILYVCLSRVLSRFKSRDSLSMIYAVLSFAGVVAWIVVENFSFFTRMLGKDSSLTGRSEIWKDAMWAIGRRFFFGYGYSGFWNGLTPESSAVGVQISSALNGQEFNHAHNAVLTLTLQVGVVGMTILAIALFAAFRNAFRAIFVYRSKAAQWYLGILLALFVAGADESIFMNYLSLMTVLLVLSCVGLHKAARPSASHGEEDPSPELRKHIVLYQSTPQWH
jgi:exopolysaccharide production protein ExoQ